MIAFFAGTFWRLFYFAMQPFIVESIVSVADTIRFIINSFPSFFFFSAYMIILFFWGEIYGTSDSVLQRGTNDSYQPQRSSKKMYILFIAFNILMYVTVVTLYLLNFFLARDLSNPNSFTIYEKCILLFAASMYFLTTIGFFGYGYYTFRFASKVEVRRPLARNKLLTRVGTVTLFSMACFMVRGGITIWGVVDPGLQWYWWVDGVYYLFLEVIPVLLMLGAYVQPKKKKLFQVRSSLTSPLIQPQ